MGTESEWVNSLQGKDGKGGTHEENLLAAKHVWTVKADREGAGKWTHIGEDLVLGKAIDNFSVLRFDFDPADVLSGIQTADFEVVDIVYNPTETFQTGGSRIEIIGTWVIDNDTAGSFGSYHTALSGWFKDPTTFYVDRINTATVAEHEFRLNKIIGIQYLDDQGVSLDAAMSDTSENAVMNRVIKSYIDNHTNPVDDVMSNTSTNPVQNKVVKAYIDSKGGGGGGGSVTPSTDANNAFVFGSDGGAYVEDKTDELTRIEEKLDTVKYAQKIINLKYKDQDVYVIDPVEYVNDTNGIEDASVGTIESYVGMDVEKHYLACDGSEYDIGTYPFLEQHIKDHFGRVNAFGGDGVQTWAVPELEGSFLHGNGAIRDISRDGVVISQLGTYSGYSVNNLFNGNNTTGWFSNSTLSGVPVASKPYVGYRFYEQMYITKVVLANFVYSSAYRAGKFDIEGSNDGTNWDVLIQDGVLPKDTARHEFEITYPAFYYQYRFVFKDNGGNPSNYNYGLGKFLLYGHALEQKAIKYEPTYFMELNQHAYVSQFYENYSVGKEIVVGKDETGRPVYKQIFVGKSADAINKVKTIATLPDVLSVKDIKGRWSIPSGASTPITYAYGTQHLNTVLLQNGGQVNVYHASASYNNADVLVIIKYTKTTDAPNSFDVSMIINQFSSEQLIEVPVTDEEVDECLKGVF